MIIKKSGAGDGMRYYQYIPENTDPEIVFAGKSKCRKIIIDKFSYEQEIFGKDIKSTGKDADNKLL